MVNAEIEQHLADDRNIYVLLTVLQLINLPIVSMNNDRTAVVLNDSSVAIARRIRLIAIQSVRYVSICLILAMGQLSEDKCSQSSSVE